MEYNLENDKQCPVCKGQMIFKQRINGPEVIYSKAININEFNIYHCPECDFSINLDFKEFDFVKINYNNNNNLLLNFNDKIIEEHILTCIKHFSPKDIRLIEIGSGSRLSLLSNLQRHFECEAIAVDPTYETNTKEYLNAKISFYKSIEETPRSDLNTILIARNMIEYLSPKQLKKIINNLIIKDGLIFLEIQPINNRNNGSILTFSEYRNFYSIKSLDILINSNQKINWISSSLLLGEKRQFLSGHIVNQKQKGNIKYFSTVKRLCEEIQIYKEKNNIILLGSGGRSLMFLYNEGKNIIDKVVDPSKDRQGVYLPDLGYVEDLKGITEKDKIIILNSSYLDWIKKQLPQECAYFVLGIND